MAPHLFPPREDGTDPRVCPTCGNGRLSLKLSKFGAFIGCTNYPECRYTRALSPQADGSPDIGTKKLGEDPETGLDVTVRSGRFGPYLQLGETEKDGEKPKRAGLPKGVAPDEIDLERALRSAVAAARSRPHPEDGEPIVAGIGRFGPYVQHGKIYANLESPEDVFTIGLNRAVTLIAEKIAKGPRKPLRRRSGPLARRPSDQRRRRSWRRRAATGPMSAMTASTPPAGRQDAGDHHARRGGRADRRARRARAPAPHARPRKAPRAAARRRAHGKRRQAKRRRQSRAAEKAAGSHSQDPQEDAQAAE